MRELCIILSAHMLKLAKNYDMKTCMKRASQALDSGVALDKFYEWIEAQGGDVSFFRSSLPRPPYVAEIKAWEDGYLYHIDAGKIGDSAVSLGAGRFKKDDKIDPLAGIEIKKVLGARVSRGDTIAVLYSSVPIAQDIVFETQQAILIKETVPTKKPLILDIIESDDA